MHRGHLVIALVLAITVVEAGDATAKPRARCAVPPGARVMTSGAEVVVTQRRELGDGHLNSLRLCRGRIVWSEGTTLRSYRLR